MPISAVLSLDLLKFDTCAVSAFAHPGVVLEQRLVEDRGDHQRLRLAAQQRQRGRQDRVHRDHLSAVTRP